MSKELKRIQRKLSKLVQDATKVPDDLKKIIDKDVSNYLKEHQLTNDDLRVQTNADGEQMFDKADALDKASDKSYSLRVLVDGVMFAGYQRD